MSNENGDFKIISFLFIVTFFVIVVSIIILRGGVRQNLSFTTLIRCKLFRTAIVRRFVTDVCSKIRSEIYAIQHVSITFIFTTIFIAYHF